RGPPRVGTADRPRVGLRGAWPLWASFHLRGSLPPPPLALERLTESARGQVVFELPHPRADGATHLLLDPLELIEKLTLLIPPPRFHTLRFHGVLAPHAAWRSAVVPARPEADEDGPRRRWDRRVRVRRGGRRCCAGCSASTSLRVRAAAAGGGWWGCTPGASAC